jgi:PAS domain S-box-containing protein
MVGRGAVPDGAPSLADIRVRTTPHHDSRCRLNRTAKAGPFWALPFSCRKPRRSHLSLNFQGAGDDNRSRKIRKPAQGRPVRAAAQVTVSDTAGDRMTVQADTDTQYQFVAQAGLVAGWGVPKGGGTATDLGPGRGRQHHLLAQMIDNTPMAIGVLDTRQRYLMCNHRYRSAFGLGDADPTGRLHFELFPSLSEHWPATLARCLKGEVVRIEQEAWQPHGDQPTEWIHWEVRPWREADGRVGGILLYAEFITDRLTAESERSRLESQLVQAQKLEAIGTLAGGIAHDFNNILAGIMGYSEISLAETQPDSRMAVRLDRVLKGCRRAKALIGQILAFSRQQRPEIRPLRPDAVVREALKLLRATLPSSIGFEDEIQSSVGTVRADATQIHQIMMNLCTNAVQAMNQGPGTLRVEVANQLIDARTAAGQLGLNPGGYVRISVTDSGKGMDAQTVRRIFEPYFTTKSQGDGTGLGLSVVHGIVASLQGAIEVESAPGCGAAFHVYLPCSHNGSEAPNRTPGDLPRGEETILLVDDEPEVLEMTTEMLTHLGYQVIARSSSLEAWQAFKVHADRLDLVITDQTMPHLMGTELAAKIHARRGDLPIILSSGFSCGFHESEMHAIGIRSMLHKPILMDQMAVTVSQTLHPPA